jgi:hypothetical protein
LKGVREHLQEYEAHLEAFENGEEFVPRLTGKAATKANIANNRKRKNCRGGKKGSSKRSRSGTFEDGDESDEEDDDIESDADSDSDGDKDSDEEKDSNDEHKSDSDSEGEDSDPENDEDQATEVTEDSLKEKITGSKAAIKSVRERLYEARKQKKEAVDYLSTLKKNIAKAQKEKNAFCSLKRSEVRLGYPSLSLESETNGFR